MAPFTILEATGAVSTDHGALVEVRTPTRARTGLHLIAFVAWPPDSTEPDFEANGWDVLAEGVGHGGIAVLRRAVSSEEPSFYSFAFEGSLDTSSPPPMAILALATGVAEGVDAVDLESEVVGGGPDFTAQLGSLTSYSDAAFSLFYVATDEGFEETDNTMLEVTGSDTDDVDAPVVGTLLVLWEMPETAGAIGDREATLLGGDPCDGTVAQIVLQAAPPAQAARWDVTDVAAIGLPTVGV